MNLELKWGADKFFGIESKIFSEWEHVRPEELRPPLYKSYSQTVLLIFSHIPGLRESNTNTYNQTQQCERFHRWLLKVSYRTIKKPLSGLVYEFNHLANFFQNFTQTVKYFTY